MPEAPAKLCLHCGYILDHLPEPRCPECGTPFDPDRPETFDCPARHESATPYLATALGALGIMFVGVLVSLTTSRLRTEAFAMLSWGFVLGGWALQWWVAAQCAIAVVRASRETHSFSNRARLIVALLISMLTGPGVCCWSSWVL